MISDGVVIGPEAWIEPYTKLGRKLSDAEKQALGDDYEQDEDLEANIGGT